MGAYVNFCEFSALFFYDETLSSTGDVSIVDGSVGEILRRLCKGVVSKAPNAGLNG